jgi:adhesin transport system outer membrane protein
MQRKCLTKLSACFMLSLSLGGVCVSKASVKESTIPDLNNMGDEDSATSQDDNKAKQYKKKYKKPSKSSATSLSGIVQEALSYHPSIEADKEALDASNDVVDQAAAGYMPTVDLRASLGRERINRNFQTNILNPLTSIGTITTTRSDPSIAIRQILFDGMGTASRVARANSQRHQARGTLGVTTDTATVDAASATIDVRRLQRLLRIVNNNIRFHQNMKQKVEEIVQAGAAPISDLFQVEARLQDTFVSKTNIESDLEVAIAKFIEVVGKEPPAHIQRIRLPSYLTTGSPEMAVRMAIDNNNSIKVARSNVQIAESTNRETAAKLVPTVTFELEGERDRNMSATSGYQNRLTAMLVARHNLFNGGADLARSRETIKRLTEAHARLNLAIRQTERTIRAAWGECTNARKKAAHLTKLIHEKRRIRDTYLNEFTVGKRTLIDILDAANDVFITEATRTTVDATADINAVILSVGTGQFKQYVNNKDSENYDEEEDETSPDPISDMFDSQPDMYLTPYSETPSNTPEKPLKISKVKKTPPKRKSIFEQRKEQRENALPDKAAT